MENTWISFSRKFFSAPRGIMGNELESGVDISSISNCDLPFKQITAATSGFSDSNLLYRTPFGRVFRAHLWGSILSIKICSEGTSVYNFKREVSLLNHLRHPNIIALYGASWEDPSKLCVVREYALGCSLHSRLHACRSTTSFLSLDWVDRIRIAAEMSSALLFLHEMRIIHRNICPGSILLDACNTCKLEGFELAMQLPNGVSGIKCTPQGTPGYIDPTYAGSSVVTPESDVYSLGITMLQLVLGEARPGVIDDLLSRCGKREPCRDIDNAVSLFLPLIDKECGVWEENQAKEVLTLALRCVEQYPQFRPNLKERLQPELRIIAEAAMEFALMGEEDSSPSPSPSPKIDLSFNKRQQRRFESSLELPTDFESLSLGRHAKDSPKRSFRYTDSYNNV